MVGVKDSIKKLNEEVKALEAYAVRNDKKHEDLLDYSHKLEDCLNTLKQDYRKMTDLTKKQHNETQQKITKLNVQMESCARESELAKRERSKLITKLD